MFILKKFKSLPGKVWAYFFTSFRSCVLAAREEDVLYTEIHQRVWWSPYKTTRVYPDGKIERVYGGEWFQDWKPATD